MVIFISVIGRLKSLRDFNSWISISLGDIDIRDREINFTS